MRPTTAAADSASIRTMELRRLRYFVAVAEEPHFRRAAARAGESRAPLGVFEPTTIDQGDQHARVET